MNTTTTQAERTRPSSRVQPPGGLGSTPVLFRLPTIELHPLPSAADLAVPTLLHTVAEQRTQPQPPSQPTQVAETGAAAASSHQEPRSWWEHWSSGVVLILLIIALVIASIWLFRSTGQPIEGAFAVSDPIDDFGPPEAITVPQLVEATGDHGSSNRHDPDAQELAELLQFADSASPKDMTNELANDSPAIDWTPMTRTARAGTDTAPAAESNREPMAKAHLLEPQLPSTGPVASAAPADVAGPQLADIIESQATPAGSEPSLPKLDPLDPTIAGATNQWLTSEMQPGRESSSDDNLVAGAEAPMDSLAPWTGQAASMPNLGSGNTSATPSLTQASAPIATVDNDTSAPVHSSAPVNSLRNTATPDSDDEAIIRAYLELTKRRPSSPRPTHTLIQDSIIRAHRELTDRPSESGSTLGAPSPAATGPANRYQGPN